MSRKNNQIEVIVVGAAAMDMLAFVDRLPGKDGIEMAREVKMMPGGTGANVAVALARLGRKVGFIARISDDANGKVLLKEFESENVDTSLCIITNDQPSALCFIAIDADGNRSMVALGGAGPVEDRTEIDPACIAKARLVYLTDVNTEIIEYVSAIVHANQNTLVLSPGGIMASRGLQGIRNTLPLTDMVLLSQNESSLLFPNLPPLEAAKELTRFGAPIVVITLGSDGALVCTESVQTVIPAFAVSDIVDTTGAGDALAGGLISGLMNGNSLESSVRIGCAAAAIKITKPGARLGLPTGNQLQQYLDTK